MWNSCSLSPLSALQHLGQKAAWPVHHCIRALGGPVYGAGPQTPKCFAASPFPRRVLQRGKEKHSHMVTDMGLQRQQFLSKGTTARDLKE